MTSAADWAGRVGDVWTDEWRRTERTFADLEPQLERAILAVAPEQGRLLDIGCGVGTTTLAVARARPMARVTGVDLSPGMIDLARERGADSSNVQFVCQDVLEVISQRPGPTDEMQRTLRHPGLAPGSRFFPSDQDSVIPAQGRDDEHTTTPYDLIFSRHGVMFFPDPVAAFARLRAAAAPGAPLVFSCFRAPRENAWAGELLAAIGLPPPAPVSHVPGPFAFADRGFVSTLLAQTGWGQATTTAADYAYVAGEGDDPVGDAVSFFARIGPVAAALRDLAGRERATAMAALAAALAPHHRDNRVALPAAAWLWTARAA